MAGGKESPVNQEAVITRADIGPTAPSQLLLVSQGICLPLLQKSNITTTRLDLLNSQRQLSIYKSCLNPAEVCINCKYNRFKIWKIWHVLWLVTRQVYPKYNWMWDGKRLLIHFMNLTYMWASMFCCRNTIALGFDLIIAFIIYRRKAVKFWILKSIQLHWYKEVSELNIIQIEFI